MLKWQSFVISKGVAGIETVVSILAGMSGKNRVIKFIAAPKTQYLYIRVYRDAEQIVNFDTNLFTTGWTLLPVDIPLAEGQLCTGGFYSGSLGAADYNLVIGYEEAG